MGASGEREATMQARLYSILLLVRMGVDQRTHQPTGDDGCQGLSSHRTQDITHHTGHGHACFSIACNLIACLEWLPSRPGGTADIPFPRIRILCTHSTANKTPLRIALSQLLVPSSPCPGPQLSSASLSPLPSLNSVLRQYLQSSPDTFDHAHCHCRLPSPPTSPLRLLCDAAQSQWLITASSNAQHFPLPRTIQAFHAAVPRSFTTALAIFFKRFDTFLECRKHCSTPLF